MQIMVKEIARSGSWPGRMQDKTVRGAKVSGSENPSCFLIKMISLGLSILLFSVVASHEGDFLSFRVKKEKSSKPILPRKSGPPNLPVSGNIFPYGIFWIQISLGTPLKPFNVAIDSGSSDLLVSQKGCDGCDFKPGDTIWDDAASSTATTVSCLSQLCRCHITENRCYFSNSYQTCDLKKPTLSCTVEGLLWNDKFALGGIQADKPVQFGAIARQTGDFVQFQHIHGVIGLAGGPSGNFGGNPNGLYILNSEGKLPSTNWSLCIQDGSGKLTMGGVDSSLAAGPFAKTTMSTSYFYDFGITSLSVGASRAYGSYDSVIVDSGTNILLVPTGVYGGLQSSFCSSKAPYMCADSGRSFWSGACFDVDLSAYPPITFATKDGHSLVIPPSSYLVLQPNSTTSRCLAVLDAGSDFFIVGDTLLENYYVVFDTDNSAMYWAPVNKKACFSS